MATGSYLQFISLYGCVRMQWMENIIKNNNVHKIMSVCLLKKRQHHQSHKKQAIEEIVISTFSTNNNKTVK